MSEMTIARGLARLKTIQAQTLSIVEKIKMYAAWNNKKKHPFGDNKGTVQQTHSQAKAEINSLYQQFNDLNSEWIRLKKAIDLTNMRTKITVAGKEMTIQEALNFLRTGNAVTKSFVQAYSTSVSSAQRDVDIWNSAFAKTDEETKQLNTADISYLIDKSQIDALDKFTVEFCTEIDGELNAVNAVTPLIFFE